MFSSHCLTSQDISAYETESHTDALEWQGFGGGGCNEIGLFSRWVGGVKGCEGGAHRHLPLLHED